MAPKDEQVFPRVKQTTRPSITENPRAHNVQSVTLQYNPTFDISYPSLFSPEHHALILAFSISCLERLACQSPFPSFSPFQPVIIARSLIVNVKICWRNNCGSLAVCHRSTFINLNSTEISLTQSICHSGPLKPNLSITDLDITVANMVKWSSELDQVVSSPLRSNPLRQQHSPSLTVSSQDPRGLRNQAERKALRSHGRELAYETPCPLSSVLIF